MLSALPKQRALARTLLLIVPGTVSAMFASSCTQAPVAGGFSFPDAGEQTPPPDPQADASTDVAMERDAAPPPVEDASYGFPLSKCNVSGDILYLDVTGPQGRLALGESTHTAMGTNWFVELQPELNILLATPTGQVGQLQVWTPNSAPAVPGTYPQGADAATMLDVIVVTEGCAVTAGTLTVVDLKYDWPEGSVQGDVTSLLMSFDVTCSTQRLRGCVKYAR